MKNIYLTIADLSLAIRFPDGYESFSVPRSWMPFLCPAPATAPDVEACLSPDTLRLGAQWKELTISINDLGVARLLSDGTSYAVALSAAPGQGESLMTFADDFRSATLYVAPTNPHLAFLIDSMIRILMSQAIVTFGGFMLHSSAIVAEGEGAALFMGVSGAGKSTHTRLWRETFDDVELLNDDLPIIRLMADGSRRVFGSPWSGKTPCWRNASAPLRAFVRIEKAPENEYRSLADVEALISILPGVSVITACRRLYDAVSRTLIAILPQVAVGHLRCLPDHDAARLSRRMAYN